MRKISVAVLALMIAGACNKTHPAVNPEEAGDQMAANDIGTSLVVEIGPDSIGLALHVTNSGTQPLVMEFNSTQRYDFHVETPTGETVWTWSADKLFGQMMGSETIGAGQSREYRESWEPGNQMGTFVAVARVVAMNKPIEQRTQFEIAR